MYLVDDDKEISTPEGIILEHFLHESITKDEFGRDTDYAELAPLLPQENTLGRVWCVRGWHRYMMNITVSVFPPGNIPI